MSDHILNETSRSRDGKKKVYVISKPKANNSEGTGRFELKHSSISDEDAILIANGHKPSKAKDKVSKNSESKKSKDLFISHESPKPVLFEPTKRESNGKGYKGVRMLRRGTRKTSKRAA